MDYKIYTDFPIDVFSRCRMWMEWGNLCKFCGQTHFLKKWPLGLGDGGYWIRKDPIYFANTHTQFFYIFGNIFYYPHIYSRTIYFQMIHSHIVWGHFWFQLPELDETIWFGVDNTGHLLILFMQNSSCRNFLRLRNQWFHQSHLLHLLKTIF